jgi:flagellar FliL protein
MAGKEAEKDATTEEGKGGKKKKIIMILPVVLLLAAGGWFFFLRGGSSGPKALPPPTPGVVISVDPITVNLAGGHFLKIGLGLQPIAGLKEPPSEAKALDLAISQFSGKSISELSTSAGRERNKEELLARIKLAYVPEGAEPVTAQTPTKSSATKGAEESGSSESSDGADSAAAGDDHGTMTAAQAIKAAKTLTVQPEIYEVYFTEFVMQ